MTAFPLHFRYKKRYRGGVPICPRCSATIHAGANDQCPACGYSLFRANALFGDGQVEFTRVVDAAGALTHQQRQELLHFLENLERSIPPVALCIYITDDGQADEFRTHAHWILNHARIHHPSFGRREQHKAIEDAELSLRIRNREPRAKDAAELEEGGFLSPVPPPVSLLTRVCNYVRDALHPHLPPPVNKAWMLILVLDVQLERACFSWGYQLDPYIDPDSINRCIVGAKFQFRERAMVTGLRMVMKAAVREIASRTRRVNAHLRRTGRVKNALLALATSALVLGGTCPCEGVPEQPATASGGAPGGAAAAGEAAGAATLSPALPADDVAEEVLPEGAEAPAAAAEGATTGPEVPAVPAPEPGAPATYASQPRWQEGDYRHLMAGELPDAYGMLFPPTDAPRVEPRFRMPSSAVSQESDKRVPGRYSEAYSHPSPAGLSDPQGLLSVEERRDVEHVLRELNANGRFRVYATLYRAGQQLPPELAVHHLTTATAQPCEYVALLLFPLGDSQLLDLGYQEVKPSDEDRHAWLQRVRAAAAPEGDGVEALLLAIREVHAILLPLSSSFRSLAPEVGEKLPHIPVELRPDEGEKKVPVKDKIEAFFTDPAHQPLIYSVAALLGLLGCVVLFFVFRNRSGQLLESEEDIRLSSPYGAGVSRYVRYLEGKESPKETRLF